MKLRTAKRRLFARFSVLTYMATPFGPGLYFHPGVYVVRFNDKGVKQKLF